MLENFIYAKRKSLFETALNNGEVLDEAIVFIEDTKEIWNHGTYFDGSTFDSSNIELSILNISNTIADYATVRSNASTAVLPDVIADMETKTEAAATYLPIGDYALKSDVEVEVEVELEESDGVYAVNANGLLIDYNTADSSCLGVALVKGDHKFMIAKSDATNDGNNYKLYWEYSRTDLSLTNYSTVDATNSKGYLPKPDGSYQSTPNLSGDFTTWTAGALSDFDGKTNTAVIAAASSNAKDMCTVLNIFNDSDSFKDWYVPALGQLALMYLNMTEINVALAKIGGIALAAEVYWSSSENSSNLAWFVNLYRGYINCGSRNGTSVNRVRFVRDLTITTIKKPLKERISEIESSVSELESNISNKADKTEIPTKLSQLENDAPYALKSDVEVEAPNGVYAVTADGELIDYNLADTTALGVALVAGEHKFMIAKSDATDGSNSTLYWTYTYNTSDLSLTNYGTVDGTNDYGYLPAPDGTFYNTPHLSGDFTTWTAGALSDFNGKANTAVIAEASSHAYDICTALNTFNASDSHNDWYVPACGQLALMWLNIIEINAALTKIGGTALAAEIYCSSSEGNSNFAWYVDFYCASVNYGDKYSERRWRFVRDLTTTTIKKPLKEKVSELELNYFKWSKLILYSFTIAGVSYDFEEGMTWEDWVNSEYNTGGFHFGTIITDDVYNRDTTFKVMEASRNINIIANYEYSLVPLKE